MIRTRWLGGKRTSCQTAGIIDMGGAPVRAGPAPSVLWSTLLSTPTKEFRPHPVQERSLPVRLAFADSPIIRKKDRPSGP